MRAKLIPIGNSRGLRIPKALLEQTGIRDSVLLTVDKGRLVIEPERVVRQGWEEAFAAQEPAETLLLSPISNQFDSDEWTW